MYRRTPPCTGPVLSSCKILQGSDDVHQRTHLRFRSDAKSQAGCVRTLGRRTRRAAPGGPLRALIGKRPAENIASLWRNFLVEDSRKDTALWVLYDEGTACRVPSNEDECLVLAERNGDEFIVQDLEVQVETPDQLLYLNSHDGTPVPIRGTLQEFIKQRKSKRH